MSVSTDDLKSAARVAKVTQRLRGTIYGHCMGDAVGLLSEFMVESEARKYYGKHRGNIQYSHKVPDMHRERWLNGDWTDDSDQMIIIMQSLIANKGQVVPSDIAVRFHNWMTKGFPELGDTAGMGIGATTVKVMHHPAFKTDPHSASLEVWERNGRNIAPNGGVMRTSVVGLFLFHDLEAVIRNTLDVCKVTHADPRCQASCVATTVAIALMMQAARDGVKVNLPYVMDTAYRHASECIQEDHEDARAQKLEELKKHLFAKTLKDLNLTEYKKIGFTYKCVGAGFWALQQSKTTKSLLVSKTFRRAIEEVMFAAGDADTNGAVAGALLGCELGAHRLPDEWMAFPHKQWLDAIINEFVQLIDRTTPGHPVNIPAQITEKKEATNTEQGATSNM